MLLEGLLLREGPELSDGDPTFEWCFSGSRACCWSFLPATPSSPYLRPMAVCMNVSVENSCCINYLTEFWHQAFYAPSFSEESFHCHLSTIALFVAFCAITRNMDDTDLKISTAL